jgi:hypothetical protein
LLGLGLALGVGAAALVPATACAQRAWLSPLSPGPLVLELRLPPAALVVRAATKLPALAGVHGLPWAPRRFTLCDLYQAEPLPGLELTLGTVGEMVTSVDGYRELAGVREVSAATFPGVRLRVPALVPFEVGAGFLVAANRAFQPDRVWGLLAFTGRL